MKLRLSTATLSFRSNGSIASLTDNATGLKIRPGREDGWPFAAVVRDRLAGIGQEVKQPGRVKRGQRLLKCYP